MFLRCARWFAGSLLFASRCQFPIFSSTKSGFLCQNRQFSPGFCSSRAQNRDFCALFAFGTLVFGLFEHKIGIFVSERAIFPWFLPLSSTKSAFLCAFCLRNHHFLAFWAQNRDFCALFDFGTPVFGRSEHKIGIFVRLFKEISRLEAEKRANFCFCALLSCYCLRGNCSS